MSIEKLRKKKTGWVGDGGTPVPAPALPPSARATFSDEPAPIRIGPGTTIYRVTGPSGEQGAWWLLRQPPDEPAFREAYAVLPEWNSVDRLVEYPIPPGSAVVGWLGTAKPQTSLSGKTYDGGDFQIWVPPGSLNGKVRKFP